MFVLSINCVSHKFSACFQQSSLTNQKYHSTG